MRHFGLALAAVASLLVAAGGVMAADQFTEHATPVKTALLAGDWQASVQPVHWRWYGNGWRWYGGYTPYYSYYSPGYAYYGYQPYTSYYGGYAPYTTYSGGYPYRSYYGGRPWGWRRW